MKKFLAIVLVFTLALSLGACGKKSGENGSRAGAVKDETVDALGAFTGDAEAVYAVRSLDGPENVWLADSLVVLGDKVYFAGAFLEESFVYRAERDGSGAQQIAALANLSVKDICAGDGALYLLAEFMDTREPVLLTMDENGTEAGRVPMVGEGWPEDWWPLYMAWDGGMLFLSGGGSPLCGLDPKDPAKPVFTVRTSATAKPVALPEGGVVIGESLEGGGYSLRTVDREGNLGGAKVFNLGFSRICGGGERWSLYVSDGSSLYGCDLASDKLQKLLSWQRTGLSGGAVLETGEGDFLCLASVRMGAAPQLLYMSRTINANADGENGPVTLVLAVMDSFFTKMDLEEPIHAWNREHPDCTIEVRDYSVYADGDPRAAELKLLADIASGDIPDMYNLSVRENVNNTGLAPFSAGLLARRGLLENLYPYIDSDGELSRDALLPGVLRALELGGDLYEIAARYRMLISYGDPQLLAGRDDWSYQELEQLVQNSDRYEKLIDSIFPDRWEWLQLVVSASGDKLVDWSTGQCRFDSDYFISALEAFKALPEEQDFSGGTVESMIRNSDGLLFYQMIDSLYGVDSPANVWGPDFTLVGLPEVGLAVYPELSLGLSAYSEHKDECWRFMRQFLLPAAHGYGFSMNKERMRAEIAREMEQIADVIEYHPYTEAAMERFLNEMDGVKTAYRRDAQLWSIVRSEAERFLAGQLNAWETAKNIQSRAGIYMAEQS